MSYHAARALLADEASSSAAGMGLVNVSIEESYQVNEDAFHDRIIKVRIPRPAQRLRLRSHARLSADGFIFPDAASRRSLALTSPSSVRVLSLIISLAAPLLARPSVR